MTFKNAIVRKPGKNFAEGITTSDLGKPDYEKALKQHNDYCEALKKCGLDLIILKPDVRFPDCTFVEDTAIVTEKCAVITNPGAAERRGEEEKIREILSDYRKIENIKPPGTVEGGDVVRAEDKFFIGISKRTNEEGARQLSNILSRYGFSSHTIPLENILHLKTGMTYIGSNNIVAIRGFASGDLFKGFNIIEVDNTYVSNCLLVNDFLLIPKGFPEFKERVQSSGYKTLELDTSEFNKMDGRLTCLSLLF